MRLAEQMCCSVVECKARVSSGEFVRWIAKWTLDAEDAEFARREAEMQARARR